MSSPETKLLQSEIIHQKKQLIFKVEQTTNHTFPNEDYKYYIYLKNISGVKIENIRIKVNNPAEIAINESYKEDYIEIGDLEDGKVKFIYLRANCQAIGKHYVHFVCHGDGTGLYYKTLLMYCAYKHSSEELIHRLHIYDFTTYEDTYYMKIKDFSNQVTQLFKTQKLPFKAGESPFHMTMRNEEATVKPFSNVEQQSFLDQNDLLKNTKEHVYHYISRENFNENSIESYEGQNLIELVNKINRYSKLFKAKFLKTGNNELRTDFLEYEPNGFIYRFGLLNSEIYHYLGTLPSFSYMSDFLFRWAPDGKEPLNLYPQKISMKWNSKVWAGRGYIVYRVLTTDYLNYLSTNMKNSVVLERWLKNKEERWKSVGFFEDEKSAYTYIDKQLHIDGLEKARLQRDFDKYEYYVKESYYDTGVFFVHIPVNKIPSNFYLLNTVEIEALIQRAKPFGAKALIRYMVEEEFDNHMEYMHYPIFKPYTEIDMSDTEHIPYFIQSKKYKLIKETRCGQTLTHYGLKPHGLTSIYNYPFEAEGEMDREKMIPTVYIADKTKELINKNIKGCKKDSVCIDYVKNKRPYPDNSLNHEFEYDVKLKSTYIDNNLSNLKGVGEVLYQNNFDSMSFKIPKVGFKPFRPKDIDNQDSDNSFIQKWIGQNKEHYKAYAYKVERKMEEINDIYYFKNQQRKVNTFEIMAVQRDVINKEDGELGIGFVDKNRKNHMFSLKYNPTYKKDYLQYRTMYNNNFKVKKDGLANVNALVIKTIQIRGDYQNTIVVLFIEKDGKLEYFHHVICPNLTEVFLFMSENLAYEREQVYATDENGQKHLVYVDDEGNDIVETYKDNNGRTITRYPRIFIDDKGIRRPGKVKFNNVPIDMGALLYHNYVTTEPVTFNTPQYTEINRYETNLVYGGENWRNLYRINKAENSYTYIQNTDNQIKEANDIFLHFDNIEIPEKSKINNIKLKLIVDSSHSKEIYASSAYQRNYITTEAEGNTIKLQSDNIECYHQTRDSQYYYYTLLEQTNNKRKINYYTNLINENIIFDESVDFDDGMIFNNPFWIETSQFTDVTYDCNNVKNIELVIEGFNNGPNVKLLSQLLYENFEASVVSQTINNGYFFEKILLPFSNDFLLDWLRLRFRFENLNNDIEIFNYYLNVTFKNKETVPITDLIETDEVVNRNKNIHYLDLLQPEVTAEELNNGITVQLAFDDLQPGEQYKIYSNELEVEYTIQDTELMINKNKFFEDEKTKFISIDGEVKDAYLSGCYYTDVNHISQIYSDVGPDNLGLELRDSLYQAFVLPEYCDNITGVQIHPNGFKGSPSATLKLGLYENRGTTPGKLIKEVYASGWSKSNKALKDLNNIKYEINVNELKPGEIYWFKLEVENPHENNYYLLKYTTIQRGECKLLLKENNNYINMSGSLEFSIYSKDLTYGFSQLPTMQDYLPNPYVKIGLHRGQGTIQNLVVKKLNNSVDRSVTNGKF